MPRTHDALFDKCPICGKLPYVETYDVNTAVAYCKGYGFHRHKPVRAMVLYSQSSKLLEQLAHQWNQMWFEEARFLFFTNGSPFEEEATNENA